MNKLTKKSPQLGYLYLRRNTKRGFGSSCRYIAAVLDDGRSQSPYLFTERQLDEARSRAGKNPDDCIALSPAPWWKFWRNE